MEEIKYGGAILEIDERDYLLGGEGSVIELEKLPVITPSVIEYNQLEFAKDFGNCLCTCYAGLGMFSNNSGKKLDSETRLKNVKARYVLPDFNPKVGGLLSEGVKSVIDTLGDGIMYRIHKSKVKELNNKGYTINIGMYVGNDLKKAWEDGNISADEIKKITDSKYGHSTLLTPDWQDSYVGIKEPSNIIKVDKDFINSWFVYDWAYIIIPNNIIKKYFEKNIVSGDKKKDINYNVELMKQNKIYPREFQVYQELMREKYIENVEYKK